MTGAVALAGCGGEAEPEQSEQAEVENAAAGLVPRRLAATESGTEDIIALALSGDRAAVVTGTSRLAKVSSGTTASELKRSGVPEATVAELDRRAGHLARVARNGSFVEVELAANAVSALMPGLYRRFETRVPAEILALDYLDREAQFRSLARQPGAVAAALKELARTWARVRPRLVAAGGTREARSYD